MRLACLVYPLCRRDPNPPALLHGFRIEIPDATGFNVSLSELKRLSQFVFGLLSLGGVHCRSEFVCLSVLAPSHAPTARGKRNCWPSIKCHLR